MFSITTIIIFSVIYQESQSFNLFKSKYKIPKEEYNAGDYINIELLSNLKHSDINNSKFLKSFYAAIQQPNLLYSQPKRGSRLEPSLNKNQFFSYVNASSYSLHQIKEHILQNCGYKKTRVVNYISKGTQAEHQDWPWNVQLIINPILYNKHQPQLKQHKIYCGGTILSYNYILTAAHCFDELNKFKDLPNYNEILAEQTQIIFNSMKNRRNSNSNYIYKMNRKIQSSMNKDLIKINANQIILHPNYVKNGDFENDYDDYTDYLMDHDNLGDQQFKQRLNFYFGNEPKNGPRNDLALVRFQLPDIDYFLQLQTICLPSKPFISALNNIFTSKDKYFHINDRYYNCKIMGQGFTNEYDEEKFLISKNLKIADVYISSNELCKSKFQSDDIKAKISNDTLCIIGPIHPCLGDSGGSLVCLDRFTQRWNLVGVTSFAISTNQQDKCGQFKSAVFGKVANYLDWIDFYVRKRS